MYQINVVERKCKVAEKGNIQNKMPQNCTVPDITYWSFSISNIP